MKKYVQNVIAMLKPMAKSLGFNDKELEGIAAEIANNLQVTDDASDEDVNAEIEEKINAVMPYLKVGQSYANRLANAAKDRNPQPKVDDTNPVSENKELKELMDAVKNLSTELAAIKVEKTQTSRKAMLENAVKGTGKWGERQLKSFSRMTFENDEDFSEFLTEIENESKAFAGVGRGFTPPGATGNQKTESVISDDDIISLAGGSKN